MIIDINFFHCCYTGNVKIEEKILDFNFRKPFSKVIRIALIADCFILFVVDVHENVGRVFPNRVCADESRDEFIFKGIDCILVIQVQFTISNVCYHCYVFWKKSYTIFIYVFNSWVEDTVYGFNQQ